MAKIAEGIATPETKGSVIHSAGFYDLMVWLAMFGRERGFRQKVLQLARLEPGESLLDVGCGTGTLAVAAKVRVGSQGTVQGIDASPEMVARAGKKADRAGVEVRFQNGLAEALPCRDAQFDVVTATVMLHHLPLKTRQQCAREIRRVLKPGGRVLAVEFGASARERTGLLNRLHRRHGHVKLPDVISLLSAAGLTVEQSGPVGIRDLHFVLATAPFRA